MNKEDIKKLFSYLDYFKKKPNFKRKIGIEENTDESLTSQEHYTIETLVKTFCQEKSSLIASAVEKDDDDEPKFNAVDAFDDIIDIEQKIEDAERFNKSVVQVDSEKQLQQQTSKNEKDKVENAISSSEKSSTDVE